MLKEGVRPIESEAALISPADSKVLHFGEASADGRIEQVSRHAWLLLHDDELQLIWF